MINDSGRNINMYDMTDFFIVKLTYLCTLIVMYTQWTKVIDR